MPVIDADSMNWLCLSFQCTHRVQGLCVVNAWMMICQGVRTRFLVYYDEWATLALHTPCSLYRSCHFGFLQHNHAFSNCNTSQGNCNSKSQGSRIIRKHTHGHTCGQPKPLLLLYTAGKGFTQQWKSLWHSDGRNGRTRGRGRAGSPLSQFEQQADKITQAVVARLTNEHREGDENNKTGIRQSHLLLADTPMYTLVGDHMVGKEKRIYILHYIISSSLSAQSPMNTQDYIGIMHHKNT